MLAGGGVSSGEDDLGEQELARGGSRDGAQGTDDTKQGAAKQNSDDGNYRSDIDRAFEDARVDQVILVTTVDVVASPHELDAAARDLIDALDALASRRTK